ncbi:MAG: lipoprotein-releasing ABC transporter ATP-binding protein LolD [Myxococcota bacterium]
MSGEAIKISDLRKRYGELAVFEGFDLSVKEGEFVCIMGASGSGKTTLLNIISGLDNDYDGAVSILGRAMKELDDDKRTRFRNKNIGFIFQSYNLLEHLNCLENVLLPSLFARDGRDYKRAALEMLDKLGLSEKREEKPLKLSGGERQRVAIARALLLRPKIVLADEPFGNLDRGRANEIIEMLKPLTKEDRSTLILATHDEQIAKRAERAVEIIRNKT